MAVMMWLKKRWWPPQNADSAALLALATAFSPEATSASLTFFSTICHAPAGSL